MPLALTSTAFAHGGEIPRKYTCEGADASPPLAWSGAPAGTRSFALIVDDPDAPDPAAPKMVYVHWVLYDLPPDASGLPEGAAGASLPGGTREGVNDWKRIGWG
ncbi:MAG TPA: YbhB/YbcL family Raf kinase inhibitor-like protein, partial [Gemmatimonadales bacterium]|nr:YbhB/YbcL family Raf kinase inhibitor-like protein [Gemmatimonadales bacterium]